MSAVGVRLLTSVWLVLVMTTLGCFKSLMFTWDPTFIQDPAFIRAWASDPWHL